MRVKIINTTGKVEDTQAIDMDTGVELPVEMIKLDPLLGTSAGAVTPAAPAWGEPAEASESER
jgi:hypothetical protein